MQEVTKKSEALARAMASDRKDMQDKVHAVDKRATEVLAMAHRAEDDVVKRIDRATRDNLRVMAELRTLIEATGDHGLWLRHRRWDTRLRNRETSTTGMMLSVGI